MDGTDEAVLPVPENEDSIKMSKLILILKFLVEWWIVTKQQKLFKCFMNMFWKQHELTFRNKHSLLWISFKSWHVDLMSLKKKKKKT